MFSLPVEFIHQQRTTVRNIKNGSLERTPVRNSPLSGVANKPYVRKMQVGLHFKSNPEAASVKLHITTVRATLYAHVV